MRELFQRKPWLWIVLLLGAMVVANFVFVSISLRHPPVPVGRP